MYTISMCDFKRMSSDYQLTGKQTQNSSLIDCGKYLKDWKHLHHDSVLRLNYLNVEFRLWYGIFKADFLRHRIHEYAIQVAQFYMFVKGGTEFEKEMLATKQAWIRKDIEDGDYIECRNKAKERMCLPVQTATHMNETIAAWYTVKRTIAELSRGMSNTYRSFLWKMLFEMFCTKMNIVK